MLCACGPVDPSLDVEEETDLVLDDSYGIETLAEEEAGSISDDRYSNEWEVKEESNQVESQPFETETARLKAADLAYAEMVSAYSVTKLKGEDKLGGNTSVIYLSQPLLIQSAEEAARQEMWEPEALLSTIEVIKANYPGGQIQLRITDRKTQGAANAEFFTVVVQNSDGEELQRETLESRASQRGRNGLWWNLGLVFLTETIRPPFYIYVEDAVADETFEFEVRAEFD